MRWVQTLDLLQKMIAQSLQIVGLYEFYVWTFLYQLEQLVWYISKTTHFQYFKVDIAFRLFCQICYSLVTDVFAASQD